MRDKAAKDTRWGSRQDRVLGKLGGHTQKTELDPVSHHAHTKLTQMDGHPHGKAGIRKVPGRKRPISPWSWLAVFRFDKEKAKGQK